MCEGLGFESGVNRRFREAPVFYWLFTGLIVLGGSVILIPGFPLVKMILLSQVINGVLLPFILIFMILQTRQALLRLEVDKPATSYGFSLAAASVPEPGSVALLGAGLVAFGLLKRRPVNSR